MRSFRGVSSWKEKKGSSYKVLGVSHLAPHERSTLQNWNFISRLQGCNVGAARLRPGPECLRDCYHPHGQRIRARRSEARPRSVHAKCTLFQCSFDLRFKQYVGLRSVSISPGSPRKFPRRYMNKRMKLRALIANFATIRPRTRDKTFSMSCPPPLSPKNPFSVCG